MQQKLIWKVSILMEGLNYVGKVRRKYMGVQQAQIKTTVHNIHWVSIDVTVLLLLS